MKPGPNLKQRSRGRNNNGGGKKHMPPRNQTYDSNGPDIRIRGNAHQVLEKYLTMARDCASQGDRIAAENYYQHAEHYFRVISSQNQANGRPNDRPVPTPADDQMSMAGDLDGEDGEGHEEETSEEASHETHEIDHHQRQNDHHQRQGAEAEPRRARNEQRSEQPAPAVEAEPRRARSEQPAAAAAEEAPPVVVPRRRRERPAAEPPAEQNEAAEA